MATRTIAPLLEAITGVIESRIDSKVVEIPDSDAASAYALISMLRRRFGDDLRGEGNECPACGCDGMNC